MPRKPLEAFVVTHAPWLGMVPFTPPHVRRRYKNLVWNGQNVPVHSTKPYNFYIKFLQQSASETLHTRANTKKNQIDGDDASALFFDYLKVPVKVIPNADIDSPTGLPSL